MNKYKELNVFLIKRFVFIIIAVGIAEYGIIMVINRTLVPFIMHVFFNDADARIIGIVGLVSVLFGLIFNIIGSLISYLIPSELKIPYNGLLAAKGSPLDKYFSQGEGTISNMDISDRTMLIILLLVIFLVIILPYMLGAFYYARIVIDQVKKIEDEDQAKQKEYEKKRNLMLSDIAHDLRTPITTVSGYAKALSDGMVAEERKEEYLAAIQNKSKRMNDLITLLFDYVRLDSEGFKLTKEKTDICELVREAAAFQYQDIEDAGMELDVDIPEEIINITADKLQLSRVITNLITNAIKHNSAGTRIGLALVRDGEKLRVIVADTGKPIDKEHAEHIFEPFVMGDESRSTKGGSGLGLSIVKKVVEMHGFSIRLVQQPYIKKYPVVEGYTKMFMLSMDSET